MGTGNVETPPFQDLVFLLGNDVILFKYVVLVEALTLVEVLILIESLVLVGSLALVGAFLVEALMPHHGVIDSAKTTHRELSNRPNAAW